MTGYLTTLVRKSIVVVAAMLCLVFIGRNGASAAEKVDLFQPNTAWAGEIRQDDQKFRATIYIQERSKERIKGEIHFQVNQEMYKLTFQGNVVGGNTVAWITDKKEGNVTFPGLYIGKLNGKTISGTWQVPSASQYGGFTVKLAE